MISLKDYAKKRGTSYESVRKQVNRYRDQLGEHLQKVDRTQYLDEEGEAFLDAKRASNPVIIVESSKDEEMEELREQNELLKAKVMQLQDMLISRDERVMELQDKILALTVKPDPEPEKEEKEAEQLVVQPDVKPVVQVEWEKPEKKWWQFWK